MKLTASGYVPPVVQPLLAAAECGRDLAPYVLSISQSLGFDSFMYGISLDPRPSSETRQFVYTTLPLEWVHRYDQCGYIDVDPRVQGMTDRSIPIVWDQFSFRGQSTRLDVFLDDAMRNGIASGISFPIRDARARFAIMALNSVNRLNDDVRLQQINRNLGDIMLFGQYFHELLMTSLVDKEVGPLHYLPLSPRERECLLFIARGLGSEDVASCMSISVRTVQMHVDSIRSKLGAANRQEAVALAIKHGIIVV